MMPLVYLANAEEANIKISNGQLTIMKDKLNSPRLEVLIQLLSMLQEFRATAWAGDASDRQQ